MIGICFLLIAALFVKGVQESEYNYSYITTDFKTEADLQNVADSALIEAMNRIKNGEISLEKSLKYGYSNRSENQYEITDKIQISNKLIDDVEVKVFYEYGKFVDDDGNIYFAERQYPSENDVFYKETVSGKKDDVIRKGVILISVASREIDNNKIYRRAIGYFLDDNEEVVKNNKGKPVIDRFRYEIHFMNSL